MVYLILIILFTLTCTSNLGSTNQFVELMEKHMPTNVKQGVQMLMWTVKGYVLAVLVVTMVRATFLSMDKLTQRMTVALVPASVKMDNAIPSVVLLILVLLDVKTVTGPFGRMVNHLWQMMAVTHAIVYVVDKIVMLFVH